MTITHNISLDMARPEAPERFSVKQGDSYSRAVQISLFCDGEPWPIPGDVTPLIRWFACDPDSGATGTGIYDTLPSGNHAWNYTENQLDIILTPEMTALPGLVQADVALVMENRTLATFNFEFYVNPAPADGSEPEASNYYNFSTLGQINDAIAALQSFRDTMQKRMDNADQRIADMEQDVADLMAEVF